MKIFQRRIPRTSVTDEPLKSVNLSESVVQLSLRIAHNQAINHIHQASTIMSDALPNVADADRRLYATMVAGLEAFERHLSYLNRLQ